MRGWCVTLAALACVTGDLTITGDIADPPHLRDRAAERGYFERIRDHPRQRWCRNVHALSCALG